MSTPTICAAFVSLSVLTSCVSVSEYTSQAEFYRKELSAKDKQQAELAAKLTVSQAELQAAKVELEKLSVRLEDAEKKSIVLKKEQAELQEKIEREYIPVTEVIESTEYNIPSPVLARYIKQVTPSANASPAEKRNFIHAIGRLNDNYNSNYLRQKIAASLIALGHDYFNDMLPYMDKSVFQQAAAVLATPADKPAIKTLLMNPNRNNRYGLVNIYASLVDESDKADVLKMLPQYQNLFSCITRLGIEKEAVPYIKKWIEGGNTSIPYFELVLKNSSEKETKVFFGNFWLSYLTNTSRNHWGNNMEILQYLAEKGFTPAFVRLVETAPAYGNDPYRIGRILALGPTGSIADLAEWVRKNKDSLVFDEGKKQYKLKDQPAK